MSGRVLFDSRVAWSVAIGAVVAILALPEVAVAQTDPGNRPTANGPPHYNRAGKAVSQSPPSHRRPVDLLDIRDRVESAGTTVQVTPISSTSNAILCVAGCEGPPVMTENSTQPVSTPFLAAMGPLEAAPPQRFRLAAVPAVNAPAAALVTHAAAQVTVATASTTIVCLAGCYDDDRRTLLATGGPLPAPAVPFRGMLASTMVALAAKPVAIRAAVATPSLIPNTIVAKPIALKAKVLKANVLKSDGAKPVKTAAIKLKRGFVAHVARSDIRKKLAARAQKLADKTAPRQMIAAVGIPAPAPPAAPVAPKAPVVKVQSAVAQKRPVVVKASNDWFNKITREQAAKKAAEPTKDD